MATTKFKVTVTADRLLMSHERKVVRETIREAVIQRAREGGMLVEVDVDGFVRHISRDAIVRIQGVKGRVLTATNYGSSEDGDNWYIEMVDDNGHYRYWKQCIDGGELEVLDAED
jgi:hypothetical protein